MFVLCLHVLGNDNEADVVVVSIAVANLFLNALHRWSSHHLVDPVFEFNSQIPRSAVKGIQHAIQLHSLCHDDPEIDCVFC